MVTVVKTALIRPSKSFLAVTLHKYMLHITLEILLQDVLGRLMDVIWVLQNIHNTYII